MDKVLIALAKIETRLDTSLQHLATKTDIYEIVNRAISDCKNNCNKHVINKESILISKNHAKAIIALITAISAIIIYLFQ